MWSYDGRDSILGARAGSVALATAYVEMTSMIVGLGTDVVDCVRIRVILQKHGERFLERVFTAEERAYCMAKADPVPHLAARFAAKEAARKAMATEKSLGWHDVEVVRSAAGSISMRFAGAATVGAERLNVARSHVSMTHVKSIAVATVVLETDGRGSS